MSSRPIPTTTPRLNRSPCCPRQTSPRSKPLARAATSSRQSTRCGRACGPCSYKLRRSSANGTSSPCVRLTDILDAFQPRSPEEVSDVERIRHLAAQGDPWPRSLPLHVTGSAVVVHPATCRVLLRWHQRMQAWLQV